jgi:ribosomal protein S12 methylthiotransferase accessory factor
MLPGKYYVKFYLGSTALAMDQPARALAFLDQALAANPEAQDIPTICSYMGVCLKDLGEYRRAIAVLEQGKALDGDRTDIHNLLGFCHFMLKEHEAAIDAFKTVVRLDPSSAIDYANIASNYRDMGQTEKAIEYYETALALDPTIDFALENLLKLSNRGN